MLELTIALLIFYFFHSLLLAKRVKQKIISLQIVSSDKYRLTYNVISLAMFVGVTYVYYQCPSEIYFENQILRYFGYLSLVISGIGLYTAFKAYNTKEFIGLSNTDNNNQAVLNTAGMNGMVRHPLYLFTLMLFFSIFIINPGHKQLLLFIISLLYIFIGIKLEEKKLIETFKNKYIDYQNKVPMLFPKLKK